MSSLLGGSTGTKVQKLTTISVQTSSYGVCISRAWGTVRVTGNMIWAGDFKAHKQKQSAGKGGGEVTGYTYTASFALGLVCNPVTSIPRVWSGKEKKTLSTLGVDLMTGAAGQSPWAYLTSKYPSQALNYPGLCYVGAANMSLGSSNTIPNLAFELVTATAGAVDAYDAAPWTIVSEILSEAGYPSARIGDLTAFTNFCGANGIFLSPLLSEQKKAAEHVQDILDMAHTAAIPSEGVLKLVPYGDTSATGNGYTFTPNTTPVYALTDDDFLPLDGELPIRVTRKAQSDQKNKLRVEFRDRSNEYATGVVTASDEAHIAQFGQRIGDTLTYNAITKAAVASTVGYLKLQRGLYIVNEYQFRVGWRYCLLEPMDIVTLSHSLMHLTSVPVRITRIEEDDQESLTITAEDFPQGAGKAPSVTPQPASGYSLDMNIAPGNANTPVIFEPPVGLAGSAQLWLATSGGSSYGGCNVWVSLDNVTYTQAGTLAGNSRHGITTATLPSVSDPDTTSTLAVDLSISGGTLSGGTDDDRDLYNTLMWVGGEFVSYRDATLTGVDAYNLTSLRRGAYGSAIAAHAAASKVVRCDDQVFKYTYDPALIGKTIYIKLQAFNLYDSGVQDLSALTPTAYIIQGAPLGTVGGLTLESAFTGTACSIKWNAYAGASSYTVEVWSGSTKRRTVVGVGSTRYTYSLDDSKADGGPYRALEFRVYAISSNGVSGSAAVVTASNPQLGAPTGIATSGAGASLAITANKPSATDYAGTKVWISTTSGFDYTATTPVYDGPDTGYTAIGLSAATYYVRIAQYDVFGVDSLTTSGELSVTVTGVGGVTTVTSLPANPAAVGGQEVVYLDNGVATQTGLYAWDSTTSTWKFTRDGSNLIANSVTADKLTVSNLAAISANLGTVTAGAMILDASGFIRGGQTYYNTGTGFWLGYSGGAYKFSLGSSSQGIAWDGKNLTINGGGTFSGALAAATGSFAGALSAATGSFAGLLSAATGTFSGTLTSDAVNAVNTININSEAVIVPASAYLASGISVNPGSTSTWTTIISTSINTHGSPLMVVGCADVHSKIQTGGGALTCTVSLVVNGTEVWSEYASGTTTIGVKTSYSVLVSGMPDSSISVVLRMRGGGNVTGGNNANGKANGFVCLGVRR